MMLGEINEVIAMTGNHIANRDTESYASSLLRIESGVIATFQAVQATGSIGPSEDFRITGSKGEIVLERGRSGRLMLYNESHPNGHLVMNTLEGKMNSYGAELKDFSEAVLYGKPLAASPEYALGELRTALAMYRSVETRKWEKVW